jgi:hypothetical protein
LLKARLGGAAAALKDALSNSPMQRSANRDRLMASRCRSRPLMVSVRRLLEFCGLKWFDECLMDFEIIGEIMDIETIAQGHSIRDLSRLRKRFGRGRWRKMKGLATVRLEDGTIHTAELHWYEAHGIGRKEFKIKFPLID